VCSVSKNSQTRFVFVPTVYFWGVLVFINRYRATANPKRKTHFETVAYVVLDVRTITERIFNVGYGELDALHAVG